MERYVPINFFTPGVFMSELTSNHLLSIFGLDENNIFVGGADGTMIQFNGNEWLPMETDGRWTVSYTHPPSPRD